MSGCRNPRETAMADTLYLTPHAKHCQIVKVGLGTGDASGHGYVFGRGPRILKRCNRVGGGVTPLPLSHHRAYLLGTTAVSFISELVVLMDKTCHALFLKPL